MGGLCLTRIEWRFRGLEESDSMEEEAGSRGCHGDVLAVSMRKDDVPAASTADPQVPSIFSIANSNNIIHVDWCSSIN